MLGEEAEEDQAELVAEAERLLEQLRSLHFNHMQL
jgi:hypothetical protein